MRDEMKIFVTGGAEIIGSAVVYHIIEGAQYFFVNIDELTYTVNLE